MRRYDASDDVFASNPVCLKNERNRVPKRTLVC